MANEKPDITIEAPIPPASPGRSTYNPAPSQWQSLTLTDSLGAIFLGILSGMLLIGWMRSEARCRALITRSEVNHGNH